MSEPKKSTPREWVKSILFAVAIAMVVRAGIAQAYVIDGPSMEPTLLQDHRDRSNDSRYFGSVDRRLLRGRVRFL